jgi:hypothetical protein
MYAYRYMGDPKTYPKAVGPMAQDVEKRYPGSTMEVDWHMVIRPETISRSALFMARLAIRTADSNNFKPLA